MSKRKASDDETKATKATEKQQLKPNDPCNVKECATCCATICGGGGTDIGYRKYPYCEECLSQMLDILLKENAVARKIDHKTCILCNLEDTKRKRGICYSCIEKGEAYAKYMTENEDSDIEY